MILNFYSEVLVLTLPNSLQERGMQVKERNDKEGKKTHHRKTHTRQKGQKETLGMRSGIARKQGWRLLPDMLPSTWVAVDLLATHLSCIRWGHVWKNLEKELELCLAFLPLESLESRSHKLLNPIHLRARLPLFHCREVGRRPKQTMMKRENPCAPKTLNQAAW